MGCAHNKDTNGFTLVEISIVMIIIGLLIGGTFGGMKLIENMQVNKTVQDLKAIESAALTFKDTYGRLPGDIVNPAARLPNCSVAPCATGGNGNRRIDNIVWWAEEISATDERFAIWSHLEASGLLSMGTKNTIDMSFGEGQPDSPIGGGYRMSVHNGAFHSPLTRSLSGAIMILGSTIPSAFLVGGAVDVASCAQLASIDQKIDDALVFDGVFQSWCSPTTNFTTDIYAPSGTNKAVYDLKGF
jgi:prepilin-type N-terminal cleavage/methylation domain-containing protein